MRLLDAKHRHCLDPQIHRSAPLFAYYLQVVSETTAAYKEFVVLIMLKWLFEHKLVAAALGAADFVNSVFDGVFLQRFTSPVLQAREIFLRLCGILIRLLCFLSPLVLR